MMRCGIPSGRPLGFLVTAGSSPKKADGGAKGIFHMCLMWALSSDISSERKISPVMSHKTSHRDVGVQGPEIPQPVLRDGLELGKVARSKVQDTSGEGQTRQVEVAFPYALPNFSSGHPRDRDLWGKKAEGVHPNEPSRREHPSGKSRPERPDGAQGEGWSSVRPFREVGARRHFEVVHKDAEPVLWSSNVVRRKQGVPFRDGSRSLRDPEVSSGAIPGGRLAVKGEAFAEEVSLPSEWPSSSEQVDEERPRSEVPLHREVIVRPERKYSPEAFSPSRKGDWGVQVDEGSPEEAYIVGHVESMQGVGIERRDQREGLRAGDSRASGRGQVGRVAGGKIYQRLGESELVPMSSGREGREDGGGKGDVSSDRRAFIGRSDLGTSALSSPKSDREGDAGSILTRLRTSIGLSATPDGDEDAEPVLWSSNVVRRKQGVPFRDGSRSLRDPEVSSGAIPGGRLAVKGEAFAEEVSLPSEWQSSSKQEGKVIVRPLKGRSPAREGDMGVRVDKDPPVESMQGDGIERRDQNEGLKAGDSQASGRVQVGRVAEGKIDRRLGESELVPMSLGREGRKDGGGKGDVSSDRRASDLEGIALRDGLRRGDVVGPEVVSEGEPQVGTSPGDGPSGGSSPLEEDAVSKGLFWMNDKTTWPAAEPRPVKIVGPKTGFDFPSGGPERGSIRPVESQPKDRPSIAPDHVRWRARQVRDEQGSSAQRDEAPGRAISERDIGPRATPKEPYPLRPAVRPSTPYKREAERAYERAFGIEGGGITAAPEGRASGTQDLPAGDVRFLAAKIEEISARAARTDLPSGRIRVIFRTSVEGAGQVHVEVSREPTGAVAVFVRVQDQGLRDELLKASPQIRQALAEGGVQLARLEVEAEDHPVGWEGPIGDEGPSRRGYYHRFKRKSREDRGWTG